MELYLHVNNNSFMSLLIIGAFEKRAPGLLANLLVACSRKRTLRPSNPTPKVGKKFLNNGEEGNPSSMAALFLSTLVSFFSLCLS